MNIPDCIKKSKCDYELDCHEFDKFVNQTFNVSYNSLRALADNDMLSGNDSFTLIDVPDSNFEGSEWYGMSFREWLDSGAKEEDLPYPERVLNYLHEKEMIPGGRYLFKVWW